MTDDANSSGWFEDVDPDDLSGARDAIEHGTSESPADWPARAIEAGFADDEDDYYDKLHEATTAAAREQVRERERADDQQLKHSIRAMDDAERVANELAERVTEWAGSRFDDVEPGVTGARAVAARAPNGPAETRVVALARRVADLADERDALREYVETTAPTVAPNLAALAGPVLAARLIALAGGLESLAKKPAGTVQVLGAEDALFAHLRGHAPSPKHGVIYTHEYVNGTRPADRGSAARALAGKLAIAARVDHYSGELKPQLRTDLEDRMATIRARADDSATEGDSGGDGS
jgi:nucleolar protein 56